MAAQQRHSKAAYAANGDQLTHRARKRFGQNFLVDTGIVDQIVRVIRPQSDDVMIEIGPGLGALTKPLLEHLPQMTVIELDRDLILQLTLEPKLQVIAADVLTVDFRQLAQQTPGKKLRVVGNLPYNISSPILFHLLDFTDIILDQHFMLQKEVVNRMVAQPCTSDYGRLSVMLQWRYYMEEVLFVPPTSFVPPPKVNSAVVRMEPKADFVPLPLQGFSELVKVAFSQKRKLMRHSLGKWLQQQYPQHSIAFDLQRRAEEVPADEYIALAAQLMAPPA